MSWAFLPIIQISSSERILATFDDKEARELTDPFLAIIIWDKKKCLKMGDSLTFNFVFKKN